MEALGGREGPQALNQEGRQSAALLLQQTESEVSRSVQTVEHFFGAEREERRKSLLLQPPQSVSEFAQSIVCRVRIQFLFEFREDPPSQFFTQKSVLIQIAKREKQRVNQQFHF